MHFRFCSLASGSAGNVTVVQAGPLNERSPTITLMIDCGLPYKQIVARLDSRGVDIAAISAIFVTHEHADHIGATRQVALLHRIPVWMSRGTYQSIGQPDFEDLLRLVQDGQELELEALQMRPFSVPHDAKEPLQLVLQYGNKRLGVMTDLGHTNAHTLSMLNNVDALILECNHDTQMLANSTYPPFLRARIGGDYGHLSNTQSARFLRQIASPRLKTVIAAHLSAQNNAPQLALEALRNALDGIPCQLAAAHASAGTAWQVV